MNGHRQLLHAIFEFARREEVFALPTNPAAATAKRPEDGAAPIEPFEPEEIRRIAAAAAAAREGLYRRRTGYAHSEWSEETEREWRGMNDQDASLYVVAAATGLRTGALRALRWHHVDLERRQLTVERAVSAGEERSTKSRRSRIAGVRVRRFHGLRHTFGSLTIRRFDLVAVKELMGQSRLSTTERYLHARPRPDDARRLTDIFSKGEE